MLPTVEGGQHRQSASYVWPLKVSLFRVSFSFLPKGEQNEIVWIIGGSGGMLSPGNF